jgi:ABC-2 type transport system ATP-binding protein
MQIKIEDVTVNRGHTIAVNSLSCVFSGPGWFGIMGANGSGKTTLLRAVAGRLPISSGQIFFNDDNVSAKREVRARTIGFAVDPLMLPGDLSPRELFSVIHKKGDCTSADPELEELWSALGLEQLINRRIGTLSSGNRQRVAIYAAFIGHPGGCVILDEPFNWLDPLSAFDTKQALKALTIRGYTLLTALHDLSTLAVNCDSGILLSEGTVAKHLDRESLAKGRNSLPEFEFEMIEHLRAQRA